MLLYRKIMSQLIWEIKAGKYPVGTALPSERALAKRFGTSQKTIHNAIQNMVGRGFLESRHGSGNFVLESHRQPLGSLAVIMNCGRGKERDDFLASEGFMEQLSVISAQARRYGVATDLLIYDENKPLDDSVFEFCKSRHFINLFFTANAQMAKKIPELGGVMLSMIQTFHRKHFAEMYDTEMPVVLMDYSNGIAKAFEYYKAQGKKSFAFFSQSESGRNNYSIFRDEAAKAGLELREFNYPVAKDAQTFCYSAKRITFFRSILKKLPPDTVIFADGEAHIIELLNSFHDDDSGNMLKELEFCITGREDLTISENRAVKISWIPRLHPDLGKVVTQLLLDNMLDGKELPALTVLESDFFPAGDTPSICSSK